MLHGIVVYSLIKAIKYIFLYIFLLSSFRIHFCFKSDFVMVWLISELVGWVHIFELFDEDLKKNPYGKKINGKNISGNKTA